MRLNIEFNHDMKENAAVKNEKQWHKRFTFAWNKLKEKSQLYVVIPTGICKFTLGLNTASMPFPEPPSRAV